MLATCRWKAEFQHSWLRPSQGFIRGLSSRNCFNHKTLTRICTPAPNYPRKPPHYYPIHSSSAQKSIWKVSQLVAHAFSSMCPAAALPFPADGWLCSPAPPPSPHSVSSGEEQGAESQNLLHDPLGRAALLARTQQHPARQRGQVGQAAEPSSAGKPAPGPSGFCRVLQLQLMSPSLKSTALGRAVGNGWACCLEQRGRGAGRSCV